MARLIVAALVLALLLAVAVWVGELIGERRERRHTAADVAVLRHEVLTTHAALMGMPLPLPESVEHRQLVALEHHARWAPALANLVDHLTHRRAA